MSLFKKENTGAKSIINSSNIDLRKYTPQALSKIKAINSSLVLLPKNPTQEFIEAFSEIKEKNIANTLHLDDDTRINSINGDAVIDCSRTDSSTIYIINGEAVIINADIESPITVIVNGSIICEKNANINFLSINGEKLVVNFKIENTINFSKDIKINRQFIEDLNDNSIVVCGRELIFDSDIDRETLKSKTIYFSAGKRIICPKNIIGTVQTMAHAGKEIIEDDD